MAELVAKEFELYVRLGYGLPLCVDEAANHPGAGKEDEPANVAVLTREDANVVAALAPGLVLRPRS